MLLLLEVQGDENIILCLPVNGAQQITPNSSS